MGEWPMTATSLNEMPYTIISLFNPYIKNSQVWKCPSDTSVDPSGKVGMRFSSYGYRYWIASIMLPTAWNWSAPVMDSTLTSPSRTYVFHEFYVWHDSRTVANEAWASGSGPYWDPTDKMTYTFADGHAKTMPVDKVMCRSTWGGQGNDENWPRYQDYQLSSQWASNMYDDLDP